MEVGRAEEEGLGWGQAGSAGCVFLQWKVRPCAERETGLRRCTQSSEWRREEGGPAVENGALAEAPCPGGGCGDGPGGAPYCCVARAGT